MRLPFATADSSLPRVVILFISLFCWLIMVGTVAAATDKIPFRTGDTIAAIEAEIEANGYDFKVAPNWVTRLPEAERSQLLSRRMPLLPRYRTGSVDDAGPLVVRSVDSLPSSFDWRNYNGHSYIGPVRNQGGCGSCYAFGACAAAEGTYNVAMGRNDGDCLDLSEAFLAFCLDQYYSGYDGCNGSDYDYEELDALVERGVCRESAYPYTAVDNGCVSGSESAPRVTFAGWYRVPCGYIAAIKSAIMTYGVVDAAVEVDDAFEAYSSGIFSDGNTSPSCDENPCYYTDTNHCIALVGWDDNGGDGYWILRNSWGDGWGENGYMRISYNAAHVSCEVCYLVYDISGPGRISGTKWNDYDADGVQDAGEPGLSHWKIFIDENGNCAWDSGERYAITDQNGNYTLNNLAAGTYVVAEEMQAGWTQTYPGSAAASGSSGRSVAQSTRLDELSDREREDLRFMVCDSPPIPPPGYSRNLVRQFPRSAVQLNEVPTSRWTYGCSATSAGMLFGYYDRNGYPDMYTGPANGGLAPLSDLGQGADPSAPISGSCSLIATMNGFDGRTTAGHVDDYWVSDNSAGPDPWEGGTEHVWGACTADYMGTNQWKWDSDGDGVKDYNKDGATTYFYFSSGKKLNDPIPGVSRGVPQTALCHGLKLFAESRSYAVLENYNQVIDSQATDPGSGFSFADFKDEIDNGHPVLVHVTGHTMLGVGYDDATRTIYIHDTWDNSQHSMTWGGDYSGRAQKAVTVIHLEPVSPATSGIHTVELAAGASVSDKDFGNNGPSESDTVRRDLPTPVNYQTIQAAYDAAYDDESILVQIGNYTENLLFDEDKTNITLDGGYNADFSARTGVSNIFGLLVISNGRLNVTGLVIQ